MSLLPEAAAISTLIVNSPKVKEILENISRLLGNKKIMVIGAGGAGKTSFCEFFSPQHSVRFDYDMSRKVESYNLDIGKLDNYPGQEERLNEKWNDIFKKINQDYYCGIIYVTAYGFHNLTTSVKTYEKRQRFTFDKEVYLNERRSVEIELLKKLIQGLKQSRKDIWMLSLTTKQDLWFSDREEVYNFYRHEGGEYKSAIDEIKDHHGNKFSHEYAFLSVISRKFVDSEDNIIQTFSENYDDKNREKSLIDFFYTLEILLEK